MLRRERMATSFTCDQFREGAGVPALTTTLKFGGRGGTVTRRPPAASVKTSPFLLAIFLPSTVVLEAHRGTQKRPHVCGERRQQRQTRWATGMARGRWGKRMAGWRRAAAAADVGAPVCARMSCVRAQSRIDALKVRKGSAQRVRTQPGSVSTHYWY